MQSPLITVVVLTSLSIWYIGQTRPSLSAAAMQKDAVQITHGPVVENVTDTTAIIAWSTNVNSGTVLRYGSDPQYLDKTASMPWGGLTHRVNLKDLKPDTTYYFQAESREGQGTGTTAQAALASFQTNPASQPSK